MTELNNKGGRKSNERRWYLNDKLHLLKNIMAACVEDFGHDMFSFHGILVSN